MESHHTKDKGDLGVLKAQLDLFEQGFTIIVRRRTNATILNLAILARQHH